MKRTGLLKLTLVALLAGAGLQANAQANSLLGPRLIVNEPAGLEGSKAFSYSSDPTGTVWGRALDSTWYHVEVVKAEDSSACSALTNGSAINGKWALVFRGDCYFSDKAKNAQDAGAQGVIIVDNIPGQAPIGMAPAPSAPNITIPVLMVSYEDGMAMANSLNNSVPVYISLTSWGFGFPNDLVLLGNSIPVTPYSAIPYSQLENLDTASVHAYDFYTGGFIANTGANDATNVSLVTDINWTPSAGAMTTQYHDSIPFGGITTTDSVLGFYARRYYSPNVGGKGTYTIKAYASSDDSDYSAIDDTTTSSMLVTDSVFAMGRYDAVKGQPISSAGYKYGGTAAGQSLTWGPLFYVTKGKRRAYSVQFSVSDADTTKHDLSQDDPVFVYLFKWTDANADSLIQGNELTVSGIATKNFSTLDSNGQIFSANFLDASGAPGTAAYVGTNSWYWVAVSAGTTYYVGTDNVNYFGRLTGSHAATGGAFYSSAMNSGDPSEFSTSTNTFAMIPFYPGGTSVDSISLKSLDNIAPAVALNISKNEDPNSGVSNVNAEANSFSLYPNPAITDVHVKLNLSKEAKNMYINIADAMGRMVYKETLHNQQYEDLKFSTSKLPAGQYYMVINTDAGTTVKPFTVLAK